ncbi:MAG: hypothetical protein QOH51_3837 [Acidobacteriota bacterium]|nr:hypothetical protein [Acidobacteriota bacterium]
MALAVRQALTGGYCLKGQSQSFTVYLRRGTSVLSPSLESIALFVRRASFCIIAALSAVEKPWRLLPSFRIDKTRPHQVRNHSPRAGASLRRAL